MHRREFLRPERLGEPAGRLFLSLAGGIDQEPSPVAGPDPFVRFSRRAMATVFEILLPLGQPRGTDAAGAALDEIDRVEDQLSVFRESSEVSGLNRTAADRPVVVEDGLFDLLCLAAEVSRQTEGAFDVTTGSLTKAWGFYRRRGRVPSARERGEVLSRTGWGWLDLQATARSVRFLRAGLEINLGSIGKGYALDRAAAVLSGRWNVSAALLHGGHSSVYAIGSPPGDERGWAVGVRHPWDPRRRLAVVYLRDQALGTSAATFQHLEYRGRRLGHVLDPRTGWPAEGVASATAIAATAAGADALATAFYVMGPGPTAVYCEAHPGTAAVLLPDGGPGRPLFFGFDSDE